MLGESLAEARARFTATKAPQSCCVLVTMNVILYTVSILINCLRASSCATETLCEWAGCAWAVPTCNATDSNFTRALFDLVVGCWCLGEGKMNDPRSTVLIPICLTLRCQQPRSGSEVHDDQKLHFPCSFQSIVRDTPLSCCISLLYNICLSQGDSEPRPRLIETAMN